MYSNAVETSMARHAGGCNFNIFVASFDPTFKLLCRPSLVDQTQSKLTDWISKAEVLLWCTGLSPLVTQLLRESSIQSSKVAVAAIRVGSSATMNVLVIRGIED